MTLSEEQQEVMNLIDRGANVLVTGSAGTGKSTILRALKERYGEKFPVCASTGIAAVGVGGSTIHSWAGLGLGRDTAEEIAAQIVDRHGQVYKRIRAAKRLAIDEISMIHGELFDTIDQVFRIVRKDENPFGGVQLILFGDFLQLPPVSRDQEQQFAFQSTAWRRARIHVSMLTRVFRQQDATFSAALNRIRVGELDDDVLALLRSRVRPVDPDPALEPVTVYTHNEDVDLLNARRMEQIKGEERTWEARDWGSTESQLAGMQKNCLAPTTLVLKVGAQVMLLWNIETENGLANGTLGTVEEFSKHSGLPKVRFRNGLLRELERKTWEMKVGGAVLASRSQIPLRLAWAITSHKSQGMTLDKIRVHLDRAFEYGQAYVALSRARTLEGLFIQSTASGCIKAHPAAVEFYRTAGGEPPPAEIAAHHHPSLL